MRRIIEEPILVCYSQNSSCHWELFIGGINGRGYFRMLVQRSHGNKDSVCCGNSLDDFALNGALSLEECMHSPYNVVSVCHSWSILQEDFWIEDSLSIVLVQTLGTRDQMPRI